MHPLIAPKLALFYFLRPICLAARRLALAPEEVAPPPRVGLKVFVGATPNWRATKTKGVPPVSVAVPKEKVDD